MKKFLFLPLLILISAILLSGITAYAADEAYDSAESYSQYSQFSSNSSPIVSLEGKTIYVIGNSHLYYGNCITYGDNGKKDDGYLARIIEANGENAKVIDHTYPGKTLNYIYSNHLSKADPSVLKKADYVIFSEAAKQNKNPLNICKKIMALFPEDTVFFFSSHPILYEWEVDAVYNSYESLRETGIGIIDWGRMIYDIYTGAVQVPDATLKYNKNSFIKDNVYYDKSTNTTSGDDKHPNPLSGYIAAQAIYTALTNRTALYADYSFCGNKKLNDRFDFDAFIAKHYNSKSATNFNKIFASPQDMAGLQKLIDIYNEKENRHSIFKAKGVAATCLTSGITNGYHCTVCAEVFKVQTLIPAKGEHTPVYSKGVTPTCKKEGQSAEIVCADCSQVLVKSKKLAALGHSYTEKIIDDRHLLYPATYSSPAVYKYDCARCSSISPKNTFSYGSNRALSSPKEISASSSLKSITLSWSSVKRADGYRVKQYDSKTESWIKVADTENTKLKVNGLGAAKKYTFRVYSYTVEGGKRVYSEKYSKIETATRPKDISTSTVTQTTNSVTLAWSKVKGADGYNIYKEKNGSWEKIDSTEKLTYKINDLKPGKNYKFSVRAYIKTASGKVFSPSHYSFVTATKPSSVELSVSSPSGGTAKLSWNDLSNESGYQVYYTDKLTSPFVKLGDYKANVTSATARNLKSSKNCYFKVRAYKTTADGKNVYGEFSETVKIKIK